MPGHRNRPVVAVFEHAEGQRYFLAVHGIHFWADRELVLVFLREIIFVHYVAGPREDRHGDVQFGPRVLLQFLVEAPAMRRLSSLDLPPAAHRLVLRTPVSRLRGCFNSSFCQRSGPAGCYKVKYFFSTCCFPASFQRALQLAPALGKSG